jgi:hypothetical protein
MKVEKNVPIPESANSMRYPWAEMEHGDSFLAECEEDDMDRLQNAIQTAGYRWLQRNRPGWKIVTRRTEEGIRVWMRNPEL